MKPFIKWVGGKQRLLPQLLPFFPPKIATYYEPFLGGGSVFFALAEEGRFEQAVLNDGNTELINTYFMVRNNPEDLLKELEVLQAQYNTSVESARATYDQEKSYTPQPYLTDTEITRRASRFIFLNKTAFNGLYRVNKKGQFNTPWGKYVNPKIHDEPTIRACSQALRQKVQLREGDFEGAVKTAKKGDCVYFDPPYVPLNPTSNFTSYTSEGFGKTEQERLARVVFDLVSKGVTTIVSNSNTELVRELYRGLDIHEIEAGRAINSKGSGRGKIKELVVVGNPVKKSTEDAPLAPLDVP